MDLEIEENDDYIPFDSPMDAQSFVRNHLIDSDDEDDVRIHYAVLFGDFKMLKELLKEEKHSEWLNFKVRPFSSTPLRLAATVGSISCLRILLEGGSQVDLEDIKGQTPLFVATSERNFNIMAELLRRGACPEGSTLNRGTPLLIAVRDGFVEGVKLLLRYGANPEPFSQLSTCVPGWPLQHAVVYAHFSCFLALIQGGAVPNLRGLYSCLTQSALKRLSIPHAILKYAKDKPEFVRLYYECGGDISDLSMEDPLCEEQSVAREEIFRLQKTPRSLKSLCRPCVLHSLKGKIRDVQCLEVPLSLHSFLRYDEYSIFAERTSQNSHTKIISDE